MHGYMMPSIAPKNNPQIIFTWLHYAPASDASLLAKPGNSRLCAISSQKLGGELPAKLLGDAKQLHRLTHSKPLVELFFEWVDRQLQRQGFTPTNPFIQALNYVRERRVGLEVFLTDPDVPIDTNHLERALRVVARERSLCTS